MSRSKSRFYVEKEEGWEDWIRNMPFIAFPPEWSISIIPPFNGALARFLVRKGDATVSIYFDAHESLGTFGEPYWEVHPYHDDIGRCAVQDTESLMMMIEQGLKERTESLERKDEDE